MTSKRLPNQTIFIPVGLPCAGKTSFFQCLSEMPGVGDNVALISPDEIREEVYPGYAAGLVPFRDIDNGEIFPKAYTRMEGRILDGWDIWFDAVNVSQGSRLMIYGCAEATTRLNPNFVGGDLHYVILVLDVPVDQILARNEANRVGHRRPSEKVIASMWSESTEELTYLPTDRAEVWRLRWDGEWKMADGFEPPAICVDLVEAVNGMFTGKRAKRAP